MPFVVAAVVAILAVPGDKKREQEQSKPVESRIASIQERTESSVNANTYVYEAIKK